ncbi:MAG TPA: Hsp20/alpha crystallin family protein [Chitinophagaceae bacterium]|nr:Hsp20/alpha crystallin family protein [Chitinophagaceae bacterium]
MSLVKRNGKFLGNFPDLFNEFFNREFLNWGESNFSNTGTTLPAVNIKERAEDFEVEMAAPGMKKEDFKVELNGNLVTISSESQQEDEKVDEKFTRREFSYQSFQRSFALPKDVVDAENISARYENGVLRLLIPKKAEARQKPPRMISIS